MTDQPFAATDGLGSSLTPERAASSGQSRLRWSLLAVFLFFAALYLSTALGRIDSFDGEMMYRVTESLVERHNLQITDEIFHSNEPYSTYGLGPSLLALPFYLASRALLVDARWTISLINPIATAFTVALVYLFATRLGFSRNVSLFVTIGYGLGSLAWPYSKTFFSEPLTTLLLLSAVFAAYSWRHGGTHWSLTLVGLSIGAGLLTREDSALTAGITLVYLLFPGAGKRLTVRDLTVLIVPIVLLAALTYWYHVLRFDGFVAGYAGKTGNSFNLTPGAIANGLFGLTISPGKGLLFFTPLVIAGVIAWRQFWTRYPVECGCFTALVGTRLLLFSAWVHWYGGVCWGPRYMVPALPFLLLPIGFLLVPAGPQSRLRRLAIRGLLLVSIVAQLPGVGVYYAYYWGATIGQKLIVLDQLLFTPSWSPLFGHMNWLLAGRQVEWLLPLPISPLGSAARIGLFLASAGGLVALLWLHRQDETADARQPMP